MKEKDLRDALLELARKKGVLTFEDLYETFPPEYNPLDEMERFLRRLSHLGVRVVEGKEHARTRTHRRRAA